MAILEQNSTESKTGFKKNIDNADIGVILNIVQVSLYQFPFKSTVREIVSNAIDANKEKETARLILTGAAKVSDFYLESDDPAFKDSKFNPDYYSLPHLSQHNTVYIDYYVSEDLTSRDLLTFKDNGVGLGGYRLEKFFSPGASTKRLNKLALGKYGIGNKSPLSTGIGVYKLISHYNGMRFAFDIFEDKIDPLIGRFNEDGVENDYIVFENTLDSRGNPVKVYYEPTTESNGVEIQVEVKKHNRREITEAVKSQLMYFKDDIKFTEHEYDHQTTIQFKSPILYEDADLIIPVDAAYYNRPHFVMNNVCYGLIDFQELELNTRYGCVGIKVDPSEIDVNPSRESVAYTQKTKDTILAKYDGIVKKIEALIKEELKVKDPLEWIRTVNSIVLSNYSTNSTNKLLSKMSGLIDKANVRPVYDNDGVVMKYQSDLKSFMTSYFKVELVSIQGWGSNKKIDRNNQDAMSAFNVDSVYIQLGAGVAAKTSYLVSTSPNNRYLSIRLNFPNTFNTNVAEYFTGSKTLEELLTDAKNEPAFKEKADKERFERAINALNFLKLSPKFKTYDDVIVPEGYASGNDESDANLILDRSIEVAKLRKAQGKIVVGTPRDNYGNVTFSSEEIELSNMPEEIWYGFTEDKSDILTTAKLLQADSDTNHYNLSYINKDLRVFRIAKNLTNQFKGYNHVSDFGYTMDNYTLKCTSPTLKNIVAYKYITQLFDTLDIREDRVKDILRILAYKDLKYVDYYEKLNLSYNKNIERNAYCFDVVDRGFRAQIEIIKHIKEGTLTEDIQADIIDEYFHPLDDEELTDYIFDLDIVTEDEYDMILDIVELVNTYSDLRHMFNASKIANYDNGLNKYYVGRSEYLSSIKGYLDLILEHKRQLLTRDYPSIFNN